MQNMAHDINTTVRTIDVILEENVYFTSLLLSSEIKRGLTASGFKKPSPIQFKAIPLGRCGFDLIVKSKSGTGKTLVFTTLALEAINVHKKQLQVLILVPTREIAVQIENVIRNIGRFINDLSVESFIGGMPLEEDIKKAKGCHIAVGAPGRIKHLIKLEALKTNSVRLFVLDEADKLMESVFQNDINEIYDVLPEKKQLISTSATYTKELSNFLANYMMSPTHVTSENETPLLLGLKQFVVVLNPDKINTVQQMKAKNEILVEIFSKVSYTQCLVFTNYQTRTESVCNFLNQKGYSSSFISAAVNQIKRLNVINNLKDFKNRILLSTDLTSRGIDVANVDLVINYDLPQDSVTYLHRMGRAGRYGSPGICISFVMDGLELKKLQNILGTIGASNLSVPKLPSLDGVDLWQVDPSSLEQITGKLSTEYFEQFNGGIKEEVLALKEQNTTKKKSKNNIKSRKKMLDDVATLDFIESTLKCKKEEQEMCESFDVTETDELLNSLLVGECNNFHDEDGKKRKRDNQNEKFKLEHLEYLHNFRNAIDMNHENIDTQVKDSNLCSRNPLLSKSVEEDTKKRKLNESLQQKSGTNATFYKNKALLSITKLLYDLKSELNEEIIQSVEEYLKICKTDNSLDTHVLSWEEVLQMNENKILPEKSQTNEIGLKTDNVDTLENIFTISYECFVRGTEKSWLSSLPEEEVQLFMDFVQQETISCESENESEEYIDFEMEEYTESKDGEEFIDEISNPPDSLQWIPVVNNSSDESNNEQFGKYFEDCSNILWQTGLTFENVTQFDNWFYHWQQQLQSVRNYVQQNIYVSEMHKYQQNRVLSKQ